MGYEITPTEHPHIVRHSGISGSSPVIKDSRITKRLVAAAGSPSDAPVA